MLQAWSETVIKQLCISNKYRATVLAGFNGYPFNTVGLNRICGESWQLTDAPHPCGPLQVVIEKIEDRFLGPSDYVLLARVLFLVHSTTRSSPPSILIQRCGPRGYTPKFSFAFSKTGQHLSRLRTTTKQGGLYRELYFYGFSEECLGLPTLRPPYAQSYNLSTLGQ